MKTTELVAMIREGVRGCEPGDTLIFPETGKIICVAELLEVADRLESLSAECEDWRCVAENMCAKLKVARAERNAARAKLVRITGEREAAWLQDEEVADES